jgi:hypothetical protein
MEDLFIKRFKYYKSLGDNTLQQLSEEQVFWQYNEESNSIAVIINHVAGNMLSRWTNFLTEGWKCFFDALGQITEENFYSTIYIRGEAHSVADAVFRQLAHYPYHIGQIVYLAKMMKNEDWKTLSIARNKSQEFNMEMKKRLEEKDLTSNASPVCFQNSSEIRDEYKQ